MEHLPEMHPVVSSQLKSVGYRPADMGSSGEGAEDSQPVAEELFIDFGGQFVYAYRGPDLQRHYDALLASKSPGGYFHAEIKSDPRYPFRKILKAAP
jgi:hypothetical protein